MKFKSLGSKLIAAICTLTILTTVLLQLVNFLLISNTLNHSIPATLISNLNSAHSQITTKLATNLSAIEAIAKMPNIRDTSTPLVSRASSLQDFLDSNSQNDFLACAITDTKGKAALSFGVEIDVSNDEYFIEAIKGKNFISDPFISAATGKLIIVYAVPYYDINNNVAGVITLDTDALHLSRNFDMHNNGVTGVAFAITSSGNTVVSTDLETVTNQLNDFEEAKNDPTIEGLVESEKRMITGETGNSSHIYNGKEEVIYFRPIEGTTWSVAFTQQKEEAYAVLYNIIKASFIALFLIIILSALVAYILSRSISKPITNLVLAAKSLAIGDTSVALAIKVEGKDEISVLASSFIEMSKAIDEQSILLGKIANGDLCVEINSRSNKDQLSQAIINMVSDNIKTLDEVGNVANQVSAGAVQISQGSQYLAQSCTEQTIAIEAINTNVINMENDMVKSLLITTEASTLSHEVSQHLNISEQRINEMLSAMSEIRVSSDSIASVIKAIDDIAFQTNILALNAAVEAARAGQYGKGFAVVAEEVRSLSSRSAKAAKETSELIEQSIQKVYYGSSIAEKTSDSMKQLATISEKIIEKISEISKSSENQTSNISQINVSLSQINESAQANTSSAEESSSSSQELLSSAKRLNALLTHYQLPNQNSSNSNNSSNSSDYSGFSL